MDGRVRGSERTRIRERTRQSFASQKRFGAVVIRGSNARQNVMTFHIWAIVPACLFPIGRILYYLVLKSNVAGVEVSRGVHPSSAFHRCPQYGTAAGTLGVEGHCTRCRCIYFCCARQNGEVGTFPRSWEVPREPGRAPAQSAGRGSRQQTPTDPVNDDPQTSDWLCQIS